MSGDGTDVTAAQPGVASAWEVQARPGCLVTLISSVGGADVLSQVLGSLKANNSCAFVVYADVRRGFTKLLCQRLAGITPLNMVELDQPRQIIPGTVYIVPAQMNIEFFEREPGGVVGARPLPDIDAAGRIKDSCEKAAAVFKDKMVGVMLSGLAGDGVEAIGKIKEAGGRVIAQNEETSLVFDGPRMVAELDLTDEVLPLWAIGPHLSEILEELGYASACCA